MEVMAGYKQTDSGVIPEDWSSIKLKQIVEDNKIPSGIYKDQIYYGRGTKIIKLGDVFRHDYFVPDLAQRVELSTGELSNNRVNVGDIIIALASVKLEGVGKVMLVEHLDEDTAFDHNVARIRLIKNVDQRYIFDIFQSSVVRNLVAAQATQVSTTFLKTSTILEFSLPLPPTLAEQEAIAEALSDADALIDALEQLLAKKRQVKQGAMQELLTGKRSLPGFSGDWETKKLGEITEIVSGGTPSTRMDAYWNGNINWCIPTDITGTPGKYLGTTEKRITELGLKNSSATLLPKGALLLCSRATIGDVKIATDVICTNQGFKSLVCSNQIYNEFLYYLLLTMKPKLIEKAIGSTFLEITKKEISLVEIRIPSVPEQTAIAETLSDMDAEISALEGKLSKARRVKAGMMSVLLTGRIRLVESE